MNTDLADGCTTSGNSLKAVFISWGKVPRTDVLTQHLGIPNHTIRYFYRGYRGTSLLLTILKYFLQAVHTFFLCALRRPRVVFITNPPVFALLPVWIYTRLFRARYVIDFHSGCFIQEHWRRWYGWQRFFARRAVLNMAHNPANAEILKHWGASCEVVPSLPPDLRAPSHPSHRVRPVCVYICSFKEDEPVEALLEAAGSIPWADFRVTGSAPSGLEKRLPENVHLTGFLEDKEYRTLLADADLVIALTTRADTLLFGAQEAIALHKPLVLSKTETLQACFAGGSVFADNRPEHLRVAIEDALTRRKQLAAGMAAFHAEFLSEGKARLERVCNRLR